MSDQSADSKGVSLILIAGIAAMIADFLDSNSDWYHASISFLMFEASMMSGINDCVICCASQ